jgi:hypothetical protein
VHRYVWTKTDLWVADLARAGLRWYPMLGYSTPWAVSVAGDLFSAPANDGDFAAFVGAFAARYGAGGSFWAAHPELPNLPTTVYGIWNEPSYDHFWRGPAATPARYMSLYLAARAAIRSVDPGARVAAGELLDSGTIDGVAYLRAMLAGAPAGGGQIDALAWHPYVGNVDQVLESVGRARATLNQYGLGSVPIEVTEVGAHAGYGTEYRAQWLHDLAAKLPNAGLNVTRLMPYVWSGSADWQITDPDGTPGLVGGAYFNGIRDATSYRPPAAVAGPGASAADAAAKKAANRKKAAAAKRSTACRTVKRKRAKGAKNAKPARRCLAKKKAATARGAKARKAARAKAARRS